VDSDLAADAAKSGAKKGRPTRHRAPLESEHLASMADLCHKHKLSAVRDFFAILLAFRGFMRGGEVTGLIADDITVEDLKEKPPPSAPFPPLSAASVAQQAQASASAASAPDRYMAPRSVLVVLISSSKTKPQAQKKQRAWREGDSVIIGPDKDERLCPIAWYKRYSAMREKDLGSPSPQAPFFYSTASARQPLDSSRFNEIVKRWLGFINVDPTLYGGHSARVGGATAAAKALVDVRLIKRHGRWKSDAVYIYIRDDSYSMLPLQEALGFLSLQ